MNITIKNEFVSAGIHSIGAELYSFQDKNGKEYIWNADPKYWGSSSPLLFPMVGNLRDGKTMINGQEYEIPKHGIVRGEDFQVLEQSDSHVVFSLLYKEEFLKIYPFRFQLKLSYKLEQDVLIMNYEVHNLDDKEMYYHIGAHPAFNCPMKDGEKFSDYLLEFEQTETTGGPVYDLANMCIDNDNRILRLNNSNELPLDYSLFQSDAVIFDEMQSRKVSLIHKETRKGIEVDYNSFDVVAFWTPMKDAAPFLCIEPWNGTAVYKDDDNEFVHKRWIKTAEPDEKKAYQLKIRII